ncbi:hypothetical protein L9F63_004705, partial [Diploptera punctata]
KEEENQYLLAKEQLLKQAAADEQLAKELQEQSVQGTSGLLNKIEPVRGMDDKENKNNSRASVSSQIRGPMDSYLCSQKKSTVSAGKFLTTSDSSFNVKFAGNKQKIGSISELEKFRSASNISTGSHDSINQEMHHFKPIKSVPRTPPKKLSDARVLVPMVVKAVPVNLNPLYESSAAESYVRAWIPSLQQQLLKVHLDRIKGVLRTSETYPTVSAFRDGSQRWHEQWKSQSTKVGGEATEMEDGEDLEPSRKKARLDFSSDEQTSSFCNAKISNKDDSDESGDPDFDDPDVTHIIGVDPELNSQDFIEMKNKNKTSSSSGVKSGNEMSNNRFKPHAKEKQFHKK